MEKKKKRMIIRSSILIILALAVIYTIYTAATKDEVAILKVGNAAPNFTLTDMDGKKHSLASYEGQGVVLNFWGTWCEPCKEEMPAMDSQYKKFKDQGVHVLAINIAQTEFEVNKFVERYKLSFPVAIDETKSVMRAYNVKPLPTTILINPQGKVTSVITGEMTEQDLAKYMSSIVP